MINALLFGVLGAVIACVAWVLWTFVAPIALGMLASRMSGGGVGAATGYVSSGSILIAAIIGFAAGVIWKLR